VGGGFVMKGGLCEEKQKLDLGGKKKSEGSGKKKISRLNKKTK